MREECANYMSATVGVCPQQWEYVRNSGSMSATVEWCSLGVKAIKMIGVTHVIA